MLQQTPARFVLALAITFACSQAHAQVSTTGIRGMVRDQSGAVIPGASVKLTDTATGIEKASAANDDGSFVFVNLQTGTFSLGVTASGFQTAVVNSIVVDAGRTTDVKVEMKVGATTQSIEVSAAAVTLETSSNEVGTTINNQSINTLPYTSRDTLNFALLTAGAQSATGGSTFNGLPNASMNISIDGMNSNSQRFKSGGTSFYSFGAQRLDAIEQVTVSTTGLGAEAAGEGAMQIRFVTKRGTDRYKFHLLYQTQNEDLNANSYFNNVQGIRRNKARTANYAGNMGGPLLPWIPSLKNRLFFFANFEELPQFGSTVNRTTVLMPETLAGNMTYIRTDGQPQTVNVLQIAGNAGLPSRIDPTMAGILRSIQATEQNGNGYLPIAARPYQRTLLWSIPTETKTLYPTIRLDYQVTSKIGWHGTWNLQHRNTIGTPNYPGGPYPSNGAYKLNSYVASNSVDYTVTPTLVNNFTFGIQTNLEYFSNPSDVRQWAQYGDRNLALPLINPLIPNNTPFARNNPVYQFTDNVTWLRNKHTITLGGTVLQTSFYELSYGQAGVLNYSFGVGTNDPAFNVIDAGLPGANRADTTDLNNARSLYALLTGRITGLSTSYNVDEISHEYKKFAARIQRFARTTAGLYLQDSFRARPHLTLNFGLRWNLDGPVHNINGIDSVPTSLYGPSYGPFQPGTLSGDLNPVFNIAKSLYARDFKNFAPNAGFSWNPQPAGGGVLGTLLGRGKTVIGGSYGLKYYSEGLNAIANLQQSNRGVTQSYNGAAAISASPGAYNLTTPLPPFAVSPASFTFPLPLSNYVLNGGTDTNYVNPNLRSPYVQDWNFRIQRELGEGLILDVRYIGNRSTHIWHSQNVNETNIIENGLLQNFIQAKRNLDINGGTSFQNLGRPGQAPIPIFETAFGANGTQAALPAGSGFTNSGFINNLNRGEAGSLANSLASTSAATYYCRLVGSNFAPCTALGYTTRTPYAMNVFRPNPFATNVTYQDSNADSNYHGLQVELRKSLSRGLMLDTWYVWSHTLGTISNSNDQTSTYTWSTLRNGRLNYGPTPFDHRHAFTVYGTYDLPIGKGKWLHFSNAALNQVVGGWTVGSTNRIISGGPSSYTGGRLTLNQFGNADGGVIFGNGMTMSELLKRTSTITSNYVASCTCYRTNVADIVQANGSVDPKFVAPGQTPGVLGSSIWYTGKTSFSLDLSLTKRVRLTERATLSLWAEASNWLNHPFFNQGTTGVTSTTFGNITAAGGTRTMLLRAWLDF